MCTESTASGETAISGAESNKDIQFVDSPTSPLPQELKEVAKTSVMSYRDYMEGYYYCYQHGLSGMCIVCQMLIYLCSSIGAV